MQIHCYFCKEHITRAKTEMAKNNWVRDNIADGSFNFQHWREVERVVMMVQAVFKYRTEVLKSSCCYVIPLCRLYNTVFKTVKNVMYVINFQYL
jgi:hypothetical protein